MFWLASLFLTRPLYDIKSAGGKTWPETGFGQKATKTFLGQDFFLWVGRVTGNTNIFFLGLRFCMDTTWWAQFNIKLLKVKTEVVALRFKLFHVSCIPLFRNSTCMIQIKGSYGTDCLSA